jgi:hypothetical protein
MRERAAALGFPAATLESRGYADLDIRVSRAYAEFVAPGEYAFRLCDAPARLQDAVTFTWSMVRLADGKAMGGGREVLLLDDDGRIRVDYQFSSTLDAAKVVNPIQAAAAKFLPLALRLPPTLGVRLAPGICVGAGA